MEKVTKKEKFISKAKNKFGSEYDYTNINYVNSSTKINIKCNKHNELFLQVPAEHLRGKIGCKSCQRPIKTIKPKQAMNSWKVITKDEFVSRAKINHGDKYDYSMVTYTSSTDKVQIICPEHGVFEQEPSNHIRGKGCNLCAIQQRTKALTCSKDDFIYKAKLSHGDKYDYSNVLYVNSQTKVNILCPKHGEFEQLPYDHISKHGCTKCTTSISSDEKEVNQFLVDNGLSTKTSSMSVIKPNQIDIFVPTHNIAIEYNGLYWHNETRLESDYHLKKTELCLAKGIQLIHIFEDEWVNRKEIVKSRLLNIFGLTKTKIFARKCKIKEIGYVESSAFLNETHLQGATTASVRLGLFYDNELVSIMTFNKPRLGIGAVYDGYELSRFCNKLNTSVVGGADKLLSYFVKTYNPKQIISYADRRWSQGGLYTKLGFTEVGKNKPNYWYIIGKVRKHRFGFRKDILKNDGFDTINKTEHQIMLDRKIYRIYDCGTITFSKKFA